MILYSTFIPLMGYSCLTSRGLSDPIITLLELGNILFILNVPVEHSERFHDSVSAGARWSHTRRIICACVNCAKGCEPYKARASTVVPAVLA